MMFMHAIQRATVACCALALGAGAHAAPVSGVAGVQQDAAGRMSMSLNLSAVAAQAQAQPHVPFEPPSAGMPGQIDTGDVRFDLKVKNAPAAQVFMQLGAGSRYNVLVPPELEGRVTLNLQRVTVLEALEVLRDLYGYDFRRSGDRIVVQPNTVQTRIFRINYLNSSRKGASDLRVSSSSSASAGTSSSGTMGSTTASGANSGANGAAGATGNNNTPAVSVSTSSDSDFWRDLQGTLGAMLGGEPGRTVTVNAGAGMIVVRATPAEMRQVADYLRAVQVSIERQVMLEAKIIEVQLNKSSESGVNWSLFRGVNRGNVTGGYVGMAPGTTLSNASGGNLTNGAATITPGSGAVTEALGQGFYGLAMRGASFAALLSFLETQGNVQVLSSPRIATLNNQKAVLKVGSDERFVVGIQATTASGSRINPVTGQTETTSSPIPDIQPFFSGISLDITPQIDDSGVVILHVHPAVSAVSDRQKVIDMGSLGTLKLPLAVSTINETDSIVRVMNGQIVAIGGLMSEGSTNSRSGVPGVSDVPAVGRLFSYKTESSSKRELVILIKPTVISDEGEGWEREAPANTLSSAGTWR